jgi:hypothetical protein
MNAKAYSSSTPEKENIMRTLLIFTVAVIGLHTASAHARTDIYNPMGDNPTTIVIGIVPRMGTYVTWHRQGTYVCSEQQIGDLNGLFDDTMVLGGNANDTIKIYQDSSDDGYCTSGLTPGVIYGGRYLDLAGLGGDDFIRAGDGDTWLFGDDGNDRLIFYSSIGQLHGQGGDDKLHSLGISATGESLFGGPGNDCLEDYKISQLLSTVATGRRCIYGVPA